MEVLESLDIVCWQGPLSAAIVAKAAAALESGRLLYAPRLQFELAESERKFLSPECLDGHSKNVSLRPGAPVLNGTRCRRSQHNELLGMLQRYCCLTSSMVGSLLPAYAPHLKLGFTSFRPAEVSGRATAWRSDDTRLHVDAFPARPAQGLQLLRVFSNVNPRMPRIWRIGEAFENVAVRFLPQIRSPLFGSSLALQLLRRVRGRRTEYDHFMLGIHDRMKADTEYQSQVPQTQVFFPSGATWVCFTDRVSHAAMSGQFALEQTFYLPVDAMNDPSRTPLRVLERLAGRALVPVARVQT
jgi:hypothetical protein